MQQTRTALKSSAVLLVMFGQAILRLRKSGTRTPSTLRHKFAFDSFRFFGAEIYLYSLALEMLGYNLSNIDLIFMDDIPIILFIIFKKLT